MTVRVYRSTDASAPVLTGAIGSLIPVLDACLVTGYGSQSSSGWTKAFSGTNLAAYKQPVTSNGMYLYIDDTTTIQAKAVGYETMSSISSGVNPFPTQTSIGFSNSVTGGYIGKSSDATATARPWILIATDKIFYFWVNHTSDNSSITSSSGMYIFGDFIPFKSSDTYNTLLYSSTALPAYNNNRFDFGVTTLSAVSVGWWAARPSTGIAYPCNLGKYIDGVTSSSSMNIPQLINHDLYGLRVFLTEPYGGSGITRGYLPGMYVMTGQSLASSYSEGTQIAFTSGDLAGKTFEHRAVFSSTSILFEISNTW